MNRLLLLPLSLAPLFAFAETPAAPQPAEVAKPAVAEASAAPVAAKPVEKAAEAPAPARLVIGAEAPALKPLKWLKGEPVTAFEKDKVYLIECWATWCGPCVAVIPHVNELHNKFKDKGLVVIGANVMENAESKAAAFVERKGDGMAYRVAFDGKSGAIAKDWLEAVGARGIPHAFVVREGKLLWYGHPARLTEETVAAMIAGKFDGAAEVAKAESQDKAERAKLAAFRMARNEINRLIREKSFDAALAKIDASSAVLAGTDPADPHLLRGLVHSERGDSATALSHYKLAMDASRESPLSRFRIATALLNSGTVRDNALALECARSAQTKNPPAIVQLILAQAEYANGDKEAASRTLSAIQVKEGEGDRGFSETLERARVAVRDGLAWPAPVGPRR